MKLFAKGDRVRDRGGETGTVVAVMPDEYDTGEYQLVSIALDSGRHVILHSARLEKDE